MFIKQLHARPGAGPLFTHYDEAAGSRVELSGITFTNWVDKTVNMLDGLGAEAGEVVYLDLLRTDPVDAALPRGTATRRPWRWSVP